MENAKFEKYLKENGCKEVRFQMADSHAVYFDAKVDNENYEY
jgi:hypothetical protein